MAILKFNFINAFIFSLICISFSEKIASLIFKFSDGALYIKLIIISTMLHSCSPVFYGLLMVREQSKKYITINIICVSKYEKDFIYPLPRNLRFYFCGLVKQDTNECKSRGFKFTFEQKF